MICSVPVKSSSWVFNSEETPILECARLRSLCPTPWPCRLLPKSARWLMANNQKEEAWKLIQKAARMNGVCQSKDLEMLRVRVQVYLGRLLSTACMHCRTSLSFLYCGEFKACPSTLCSSRPAALMRSLNRPGNTPSSTSSAPPRWGNSRLSSSTFGTFKVALMVVCNSAT